MTGLSSAKLGSAGNAAADTPSAAVRRNPRRVLVFMRGILPTIPAVPDPQLRSSNQILRSRSSNQILKSLDPDILRFHVSFNYVARPRNVSPAVARRQAH